MTIRPGLGSVPSNLSCWSSAPGTCRRASQPTGRRPSGNPESKRIDDSCTLSLASIAPSVGAQAMAEWPRGERPIGRWSSPPATKIVCVGNHGRN
jgi:hypothetical protein